MMAEGDAAAAVIPEDVLSLAPSLAHSPVCPARKLWALLSCFEGVHKRKLQLVCKDNGRRLWDEGAAVSSYPRRKALYHLEFLGRCLRTTPL